jgi:hypothetical protein
MEEKPESLPFSIHPSLITPLDDESSEAELIKHFRRLLVQFKPTASQFFVLFRELRQYFLLGHDQYWQTHSEMIADDIPCSQEEYFENQNYYDRYRHPRFRIISKIENDTIGGYTKQDFIDIATQF